MQSKIAKFKIENLEQRFEMGWGIKVEQVNSTEVRSPVTIEVH